MDALAEIRELLPIWLRSGALALGVLPFAASWLATAFANGLVAHRPCDPDALALRAALLAQGGSCADAAAELARSRNAAAGRQSPWIDWAAITLESCGEETELP